MTETEASGIIALTGFILVFFAIFMIFIIALSIVVIISNWKIFTKAHEEGWKSIIPIYNQIVLCQITGTSPWWIVVVFVVSFVAGIISAFFPPASLLTSAATLYFAVILNINLARAFKKDTGFAIGLTLLSIVFYPILAFGKDEYVGIDPIEDPVMNTIEGMFGSNNTNNNTNNNNEKVKEAEVIEEKPKTKKTTNKICPNCGEKISSKSTFCSNCGEKID